MNYHRVYGYPWRWALLAEFCWRVERLPLRHEGQLFARPARWGYRWRKYFERKGSAL